MTQVIKCFHICDRSGKHVEEEELTPGFFGKIKKPKYPDGWEFKTDDNEEKHWLCRDCVADYYKNFRKFMNGG